jgi:hypothetical protein
LAHSARGDCEILGARFFDVVCERFEERLGFFNPSLSQPVANRGWADAAAAGGDADTPGLPDGRDEKLVNLRSQLQAGTGGAIAYLEGA